MNYSIWGQSDRIGCERVFSVIWALVCINRGGERVGNYFLLSLSPASPPLSAPLLLSRSLTKKIHLQLQNPYQSTSNPSSTRGLEPVHCRLALGGVVLLSVSILEVRARSLVGFDFDIWGREFLLSLHVYGLIIVPKSCFIWLESEFRPFLGFLQNRHC